MIIKRPQLPLPKLGGVTKLPKLSQILYLKCKLCGLERVPADMRRKFQLQKCDNCDTVHKIRKTNFGGFKYEATY